LTESQESLCSRTTSIAKLGGATALLPTACSAMSKVKPPKKPRGAPNKHLHARTTFLYQAATYLALRTSLLALELGSDLQQFSRKAQLRLSMNLKRSICKSCNSILAPGRTATQTVENSSRGGTKPWADVLVIQCDLCGSKKSFPIGAKKQAVKRKPCPETDFSATPNSDPVLTETDFRSATA
jgi:ribonuclease P protein subunit RPR2